MGPRKYCFCRSDRKCPRHRPEHRAECAIRWRALRERGCTVFTFLVVTILETQYCIERFESQCSALCGSCKNMFSDVGQSATYDGQGITLRWATFRICLYENEPKKKLTQRSALAAVFLFFFFHACKIGYSKGRQGLLFNA